MPHDWLSTKILYPLASRLIPLATFGRVRVAARDARDQGAWRVTRLGATAIQIGPDLAAVSLLCLIAMDVFSLMTIDRTFELLLAR